MPAWLRYCLIVLGIVLLVPAGLIASFLWAARNPPAEPDLPGKLSAETTEFAGRERSWIVYAPAALEPGAPMVLALPGSGQTAATLRVNTRYRFEELAERHGFLMVYPQAWLEGGAGGPEWNDCRKNTAQPAHLENVDDVGFLVWLYDRLAAQYAVDRTRVYALGVSDGGQMTNRLATEHPERLAAAASIIALQAAPENSNCNGPRGPVPFLFMVGDADPIIPFDGGDASFYGYFSAGRILSLDESTAHWRAVNGNDADGITEALPDKDGGDGSTVRRTRWAGGAGAEVVAYVIEGGGHTIPGGWMGLPAWILGAENQDISAADEIWAFFSRHRRVALITAPARSDRSDRRAPE